MGIFENLDFPGLEIGSGPSSVRRISMIWCFSFYSRLFLSRILAISLKPCHDNDGADCDGGDGDEDEGK